MCLSVISVKTKAVEPSSPVQCFYKEAFVVALGEVVVSQHGDFGGLLDLGRVRLASDSIGNYLDSSEQLVV